MSGARGRPLTAPVGVLVENHSPRATPRQPLRSFYLAERAARARAFGCHCSCFPSLVSVSFETSSALSHSLSHYHSLSLSLFLSLPLSFFLSFFLRALSADSRHCRRSALVPAGALLLLCLCLCSASARPHLCRVSV